MQAIQVRYFGPTDFKGSRLKASAQAGSITIGWDHALNSQQNYRKAANALIGKFNWMDNFDLLVGGQLPNGDYAFIMVTEGFENG